jgi:hypothetical protein
MATPSSMTELEAVNVLLTTIGEAPINTLVGNQVVDVAVAKQVLTEISREVQSQGWHFNSEYGVVLTPNFDKKIAIPANTSRIDVNGIDVVNRGGYLFNLQDRTFIFDNPIEADIVYYQDFETLPDVAKRYIVVRASRIFADRMINSESTHQFTLKDEQKALIDLKEFEGDTGDYNMLESYSVARVIAGRYNRRIF